MERAVRAAAGSILENIVLFDVYKGSHIPAGKKSVAFNLVLRRADRTITDEESESTVQKALAALAKLGAEPREAKVVSDKKLKCSCYFNQIRVFLLIRGDFDETGADKSVLHVEKEYQIRQVLTEVYEALSEKGYNPINQIVGYILSEDPTYITTYNNARSLIRKIDRDELLQTLVRSYLNTK